MPFFTSGMLVATLILTATEISVQVALSYIQRAMVGKPPDPGRTVSYREAASPRRVIYGQCRVGSNATFLHISAGGDPHPNQYLVMVQTICGHEINALVATVFDGAPVVWGGYNTNPRMPLMWEENGIYGKQLWGDWKLGKPCEPSFPGIVAITTRDGSNLWTSAHRQDGCASVALILSWNSDRFPNGAPKVNFDVQGKKLYDPRTGTTYYSKNAALCIYDFLVNKEYGMGADPAAVNTASVIAAANSCDENVGLKAGGNEHRYEVHGMFSVDSQPGEILKQLAAAMAGYVIFSQGQWYLIPGVWIAPTVQLTDDDLRGPAQFRTLTPKRELCNSVRGTFYAALRKYQKCDFPPVVHPEHICDDSGYSNSPQKGQWLTGTPYSVADCVIDSASRQVLGTWKPATLYHVNDYVNHTLNGVTSVYVCTIQHTSSAAGATGNEPGVGNTWQSDWVDATGTFTEFRGGVYICTATHTSAASTEPGIGSTWNSYWVEAKNYTWKDIELNFTTSAAMAQRIAKINLERTRNMITGVLKCKLSALQLQPGDIFQYSHPRFGWATKAFQVMQSDFVMEEQNGAFTLGVDLKVQEVSPAIYAWDPSSEEQALGVPSQPVIPDTEVPRPTPAAYGPGFTYTTFTQLGGNPSSRITFSWDYTGGNAIILLDQENTEYTPQGNQAVTGLTPSTTYEFYPYYNRPMAAFMGSMSDGVGTPPWVEIPSSDPGVNRSRMAEWQRTGNIPLALNPVSISTPASGSGGGGGGGDGGCLHTGMLVKEVDRGIIRCEDVKVGDCLWSAGDQWVQVLDVDRRPHDLWAVIKFNNGAEVTVTTGHPFTLSDGSMKRASELCMEDAIPTPTGIAYPRSILFEQRDSEKVPITVQDPHTFYASADGINWVLTHNIQGTQ